MFWKRSLKAVATYHGIATKHSKASSMQVQILNWA